MRASASEAGRDSEEPTETTCGGDGDGELGDGGDGRAGEGERRGA